MNRSCKVFSLFVLVFLILPLMVFAGGNKEMPQIPPVTSGVQYLSPNGDGIQEEATLDFTVTLYVKSESGYVPEYGLRILDDTGKTVVQKITKEDKDIGFFASLFRGYDEFTMEKSITWDGRDDSGKAVPDGVYTVEVWVKDANKNETRINVDDFVIDTVPPRAVLEVPELLLLAPNGDGHADTFSLGFRDASVETEWVLEVRNEEGTVVSEKVWNNTAPDRFTWDGLDDRGEPAEDGIYSVVLSSTDEGGNSFLEAVEGLILDPRAPMIRYQVDHTAFSPNDDGIQDEAIFDFEYDDPQAQSWSWTLSRGGQTVRTERGTGTPPARVVVDGRDDQGGILPQGDYVFLYTVTYENGWKPSVEEVLTLDVTPPTVRVSASSPIFSPNGDGQNDRTNISFKSSEVVTWMGSILDMNGQAVIETGEEQTVSLLAWDGSDKNGQTVEDGEYLVLAAFTDRAGNIAYSEPLTIRVDTRSVGLALKAPAGFSPNNDGFNDTFYMDVEADLYEDVERWTLKILDQKGQTLRTFSGTDTLPRTLSWDGTREAAESAGVPVTEGIYAARLLVEYRKGDVVGAATEPFYADVNPPRINLLVTTDPFAKTDEGIEGNVFMSLQVENESIITDWVLDVYDDRGHILRSYHGAGDPSGDIAWSSHDNGINLSEDMDAFTIALRVTDAGGNVSRLEEKVPLDILVVRRDGKLYLMVPNIIFGAYQHALSSAGPALETRNRDSLKQVVNIYRRYPSFGLGLEAHALNIYRGGSREAAEEEILFPLTERRAETVKAALIELGVPSGAISSNAYGGEFPIADVTDRASRWKNRRVEFIMVE